MLRPNRLQVELRPTDLESLLVPDHPARAVWAYVEGLDLSPLYDKIKSVEGHVGRDATDPAILMGLWLYATSQGVGSARAMAGCVTPTMPTDGSAAACRSTIIRCPISGWSMLSFWTTD